MEIQNQISNPTNSSENEKTTQSFNPRFNQNSISVHKRLSKVKSTENPFKKIFSEGSNYDKSSLLIKMGIDNDKSVYDQSFEWKKNVFGEVGWVIS